MTLVPTLELLVYRLNMADYLGRQGALDAQCEGQYTSIIDALDTDAICAAAAGIWDGMLRGLK